MLWAEDATGIIGAKSARFGSALRGAGLCRICGYRRAGATSHDGGADERRQIAALPAERLALAWALPHRRSARMLRVTAAVAGLFCAILPLLLLVWMAILWGSA